MDEKMQKELVEVKSNLRSTVISSVLQLNLSSLMRDYRSLTGEAVPYKKFGYASVIDFIRERCSDVIELADSSTNPMVTATITEQNRHIASLVCKQKIPSSKKRKNIQSTKYNCISQFATPYHATPYHATPYHATPYHANYNLQQQYRQEPARSNLTYHKPQLERKDQPRTHTFSNEKQHIMQNQNQNKGIDNSRNQIEHSYQSLEDIEPVKSLDRQQIKQNQIIDPINSHDRQQIKQNQAVETVNSLDRQQIKQNQIIDPINSHDRQQIKQNQVIEPVNSLDRQQIKQNIATGPTHNNYIDFAKTHGRQNIEHYQVFDHANNHGRPHINQNQVFDHAINNFGQQIKQNHGSNQGNNHDEQQVQQAEEDIQPKIHYKSEETQSVGQVSNSLSQQDSGRHSMSAYENMFEVTKENLKKLIRQHPEGIECIHLQKLYRAKFNTELCYKSMGFSSLVEMCRALEDVFRILHPTAYSHLLLIDARLPKSYELELQRKIALAEMQQAAASDSSDEALPGAPYEAGLFPEDCVQFQEGLPKRSVTELRAGEYYEVLVAEVLDPSHFWFQQLGERYSGAMNAIMDVMTEYYTTGAGRDGAMQPGAVQVGQYCAAPFGAEGYHRSIIVKKLNEGLVKVRHVDYGTVAVVQQVALRALRREWAVLPAQALRGRLYRLRPANNTNWSHSAAERFLHLVYNAKLIAEVIAIDPEEEIVDIILADTSTKKDKFINDTLVYEEFGSVGEVNPKILEPFLRPSFNDLENGRAMNYDTRLKLLNNNLDPELFDEYGGERVPESSLSQGARREHLPARATESASPDRRECETAHAVRDDVFVDSDPEDYYEFYGNKECQYDTSDEVTNNYSYSLETQNAVMGNSDIKNKLSDLAFNRIPLELPATRSSIQLDMEGLTLEQPAHYTGHDTIEYRPFNDNASNQNINCIPTFSNILHPTQNFIPSSNIPVYPQQLNNGSTAMFTTPPPPFPHMFPMHLHPVHNLAYSTPNATQQYSACNPNMVYPMHQQTISVSNHSQNVSQQKVASRIVNAQQNILTDIVTCKQSTASHITPNNIIKPHSDNQHVSSRCQEASVRPMVLNQLPQNSSANFNNAQANTISQTASTHHSAEQTSLPINLVLSQKEIDIFQTVSVCDVSLANQIILQKIEANGGQHSNPPGLDLERAHTTTITLLPVELGIFRHLAVSKPTTANRLLQEKIDYHRNLQR